MNASSIPTPDPASAGSPMFDEDDSPKVTVRGQEFTAADARRFAVQLRVAADRVQLVDPDAIDVLQAGARAAGVSLSDLARQAGVEKVDPEEWTRSDARHVALALGGRRSA